MDELRAKVAERTLPKRTATLEDLIFADERDCIRPFPNGTSYEVWQEGNCIGCEHYRPDADIFDPAATPCALDAALARGLIVGVVHPTLFRLWGMDPDADFLGSCKFRLYDGIGLGGMCP